MTAFSRLALSRYLTLYAALYAGFGVQSPTSRVFSKVATCDRRRSRWCWPPAAQCA
jgi:hypothetical protein